MTTYALDRKIYTKSIQMLTTNKIEGNKRYICHINCN